MVPHEINPSGVCTTCDNTVLDKEWVKCLICSVTIHANCGDSRSPAFCTKSFLTQYKGLKCQNFPFLCNSCLTKREIMEASSMKDQLDKVVSAVALLTNEVKMLKSVNIVNHTNANNDCVLAPQISSDVSQTLTVNTTKDNPPVLIVDDNTSDIQNENLTKSLSEEKSYSKVLQRPTVCIKNSESETLDLEKVKSLVTSNGIQVSKTTVNQKNGDVYVELPSDEERDKLIPLLNTLSSNSVHKVSVKTPIIQLRNVQNFVDKDKFVDDIKLQNSKIKDQIELGSTFTVLFSKQKLVSSGEDPTYIVVIRVSPEIRDLLKKCGDRIYLGFTSYKVEDRFYVKTCNKCHRFGHYHAECTHKACCGYCASEDHSSDNCSVKANKDFSQYRCVNCNQAKRESSGHSSHWHKCPMLLQQQEKVRNQIPYFSTKNL